MYNICLYMISSKTIIQVSAATQLTLTKHYIQYYIVITSHDFAKTNIFKKRTGEFTFSLYHALCISCENNGWFIINHDKHFRIMSIIVNRIGKLYCITKTMITKIIKFTKQYFLYLK